MILLVLMDYAAAKAQKFHQLFQIINYSHVLNGHFIKKKNWALHILCSSFFQQYSPLIGFFQFIFSTAKLYSCFVQKLQRTCWCATQHTVISKTILLISKVFISLHTLSFLFQCFSLSLLLNKRALKPKHHSPYYSAVYLWTSRQWFHSLMTRQDR